MLKGLGLPGLQIYSYYRKWFMISAERWLSGRKRRFAKPNLHVRDGRVIVR